MLGRWGRGGIERGNEGNGDSSLCLTRALAELAEAPLETLDSSARLFQLEPLISPAPPRLHTLATSALLKNDLWSERRGPRRGSGRPRRLRHRQGHKSYLLG